MLLKVIKTKIPGKGSYCALFCFDKKMIPKVISSQMALIALSFRWIIGCFCKFPSTVRCHYVSSFLESQWDTRRNKKKRKGGSCNKKIFTFYLPGNSYVFSCSQGNNRVFSDQLRGKLYFCSKPGFFTWSSPNPLTALMWKINLFCKSKGLKTI